MSHKKGNNSSLNKGADIENYSSDIWNNYLCQYYKLNIDA